MKISFLILSLLLSFNMSFAGPSVSGGVPPHPAITTMSLVVPQPGIDYPTDSSTQMTTVLALHENRIPLFDALPVLENAQAGIDYPTDWEAPLWTSFQRVLVFSPTLRIPVRLSLQDEVLFWVLPSGQQIEVSKIVRIQRAEAGVDYPTDFPMDTFYVLILDDESRIFLK